MRPMPIHECPWHFGGGRTRNRACDGTRRRRPMSLARLRLHHGQRNADADPRSLAVDGSDPPSRHASIGIGEDGDVHPHRPLRCGSLPSISPVQEGCLGTPGTGASRVWRNGLRFERYVWAMAAVGGGSVDPPCWPRRLEAFPHGIIGSGATPGGRGAGVRKHTRPRTRTRPSDWWVATASDGAARTALAGLSAEAQDAAAPADRREAPCESPGRRSVNRTPASFAHSSAAVSRAPLKGSELRRGARSAMCCRGGLRRGRPAVGPVSPAPRCASWRPGDRRTPPGSGPRPREWPPRFGRTPCEPGGRVRLDRRARPSGA